jgi:hypothetical protein
MARTHDIGGRPSTEPLNLEEHTLADEEAKLHTIMRVLGHTSLSMAMVYAQVGDPEVLRDYHAARRTRVHTLRPEGPPSDPPRDLSLASCRLTGSEHEAASCGDEASPAYHAAWSSRGNFGCDLVER